MTDRTTIPVRRETKQRLADHKRDDETWDEFVRRLSTDEPIEFGAWTDGATDSSTQTDQEPMEFGSWSDEMADRALERIREGRGRE